MPAFFIQGIPYIIPHIAYGQAVLTAAALERGVLPRREGGL